MRKDMVPDFIEELGRDEEGFFIKYTNGEKMLVEIDGLVTGCFAGVLGVAMPDAIIRFEHDQQAIIMHLMQGPDGEKFPAEWIVGHFENPVKEDEYKKWLEAVNALYYRG